MTLQHDLGEKDPASEKIYLPYETKLSYWKSAVKEAIIEHPDTNWDRSKDLFYKIWNGSEIRHSKFKQLVIKKNPPINKCKECDDSYKKLTEAKTLVELQKIRQERSAHFQEVREERRVYNHHKSLALADPKTFASLNIDGMDQAKTAVPYAEGKRERNENHGSASTTARVIAVVIHGKGTLCFVAPADIPHTADTTMTVLMDSFRFLTDMSGQLPPHLFLQMDNTNADNKTHSLLAWAASLVQCGLFQTVELSFLPVGHTHADVDQKFSQISRFLFRCPVHTYHELAKACEQALPNECIYSCVLKRSWIVNFKRFYDYDSSRSVQRFNPKIFAGSRNIHGFRFDVKHKDDDGVVWLYTKDWLRMHDWIRSLDKLELMLPSKLFVLPPQPLPHREICNIISALRLELGKHQRVVKYLPSFENISDDEDASSDLSGDELEDIVERPIQRSEVRNVPTRRRVNEQTLNYWLKLRRHQRNLHRVACQTCINLTTKRQDISISYKLPQDIRKANLAEKEKLNRDLMQHLQSASCDENLELEEDDCGVEAWNFYRKLLTSEKVKITYFYVPSRVLIAVKYSY